MELLSHCMDSATIRKKFLEFFSKRGHAIVPSSSLIPDDPSVLLTTAGMQQFKPYYTGEADPLSVFKDAAGKPTKNTASIQKSFRTSDIYEVGDDTHLTFFEMLGNFSFGYKPGEPVSPRGGYGKREAIRFAHEFITREMGLAISYVSIFRGSDVIAIPKDEESRAIWQELGVSDSDIREEGMEDVFWGPTGSSGRWGPTTEIYCKNAAGEDIEIWNIVFNQFFYPGSREELLGGASGKTLEPLKTFGVDTGMGLERLAMVSQNASNIFETDLFTPFRIFLAGAVGREEEMRIIADHTRAATFLISDGVRPSNKGAGYILRRLIRRVIVQLRRLGFSQELLLSLAERVADQYGYFYDELRGNHAAIKHELGDEIEKFSHTLKVGMKEFFIRFPDLQAQRVVPGQSLIPHQIKRISGDDAFYFQQSYGLTLDIIRDLARRGGHIVEVNECEFEQAIKRHQEISRAGVEKKFGGHGLLLDTGELKAGSEEELKIVTRLHTATHLLNAALHQVLGDSVEQRGSDITAARTRFDFLFPRKLTPEEIQKIEELVNDAIEKDLPVSIRELPLAEAKKSGALFFSKGHYPERVKVYTIGNDAEPFSKELCGGPHVARTGAIGRFRILKEESSSAGVRRIRATVEG